MKDKLEFKMEVASNYWRKSQTVLQLIFKYIFYKNILGDVTISADLKDLALIL